MAPKFTELRSQMPADAWERADRRTAAVRAELPLHELCERRRLSQEELSQILNVGQASISKLERRADMYLSTLRRSVEAMGGELEIAARFPKEEVRIRDPGGAAEPPGASQDKDLL